MKSKRLDSIIVVSWQWLLPTYHLVSLRGLLLGEVSHFSTHVLTLVLSHSLVWDTRTWVRLWAWPGPQSWSSFKEWWGWWLGPSCQRAIRRGCLRLQVLGPRHGSLVLRCNWSPVASAVLVEWGMCPSEEFTTLGAGEGAFTPFYPGRQIMTTTMMSLMFEL